MAEPTEYLHKNGIYLEIEAARALGLRTGDVMHQHTGRVGAQGARAFGGGGPACAGVNRRLRPLPREQTCLGDKHDRIPSTSNTQ